jgi:hypothetical protein
MNHLPLVVILHLIYGPSLILTIRTHGTTRPQLRHKSPSIGC